MDSCDLMTIASKNEKVEKRGRKRNGKSLNSHSQSISLALSLTASAQYTMGTINFCKKRFTIAMLTLISLCANETTYEFMWMRLKMFTFWHFAFCHSMDLKSSCDDKQLLVNVSNGTIFRHAMSFITAVVFRFLIVARSFDKKCLCCAGKMMRQPERGCV